MRRALYVLLLAACDQPAPPPSATPTAAEDRYGVYAEALRYLYAASSDRRLIVATKTARHLGLADTNELRQRMKDFAADYSRRDVASLPNCEHDGSSHHRRVSFNRMNCPCRFSSVA